MEGGGGWRCFTLRWEGRHDSLKGMYCIAFIRGRLICWLHALCRSWSGPGEAEVTETQPCPVDDKVKCGRLDRSRGQGRFWQVSEGRGRLFYKLTQYKWLRCWGVQREQLTWRKGYDVTDLSTVCPQTQWPELCTFYTEKGSQNWEMFLFLFYHNLMKTELVAGETQRVS